MLSSPVHGKRGRARSFVAASLLLAATLTGMLAVSAVASAAPVNSSAPTITYMMSNENPNATGLQTLIPAVDANGNAITGPQVGFVLLANPGNWTGDNPGDPITYTYQWWTSATATASAAGTSISRDGKAADFAPTTAQIGSYIGVTVTATDTTTGTSSTAFAETATPGVGLNPAQTSKYTTAMNQPESDGGLPPYDTFAYLTAYGFPDNTPPSAGIAYPATTATTFPNNSTGVGIHTSASGTGTYSDPVTTADYTGMLPAGSEIYIPSDQKYYIVEDSCTECRSDITGSGTNSDGTLGVGQDGGPGLVHFDRWVGGEGEDFADVVACEDQMTGQNQYGGPLMTPIVLNPPSDEPVDTNPIYDAANNTCDGKPLQGGTVGEFTNATAPSSAATTGTWTASSTVPATSPLPDGTGDCMTDPGNSATAGTRILMKPCHPGAANQNFSFWGSYIMINNMCVDMGDGTAASSPSGTTPLVTTLRKCNDDATQQWSENPDGTINDIQSSNWGLGELVNPVTGHEQLYALNVSNTFYVDNYWNYPGLVAADGTADPGSTAPVTVRSVRHGSPVSGLTLRKGSAPRHVFVRVSGLTTPTFQLELAPDPDPAPGVDDIALHATADRCPGGGRFPSTAAVDSAGNPYPPVADELKECSDGTWSGVVTIPDDGSVITGTYQVIVNSQVDYLPLQRNGATTAVVAGGTISGTTLSEFSASNLTTPITGASDPITVTVSAAPPSCNDGWWVRQCHR
jgi:hypothetical protein